MPRAPTDEQIVERAMAIWVERELEFPARVRRMKPDAMDYATGTWAIVTRMAYDELTQEVVPQGDLFE